MNQLHAICIVSLAWSLAAIPVMGKDKGQRSGDRTPRKTAVQPVAQHGSGHGEPWLDVDVYLPGRADNSHDYFNRHPHHYKNLHHPLQKGKKTKGLPPGLAKKVARGRPLPPGWQKKLVVGQVLPQEIYVHAEPVPPPVVAQLPPARKGTITVVISGKIVRLIEATMEILDVFEVGHLSHPL